MSPPRIASSNFSAAIAARRSAASRLLNLTAVDLRAFLADRRGDGLGASSAAREMSAVRGLPDASPPRSRATSPQLPRTRAPKRPRTLPRPASPADAHGAGRGSGAGATHDVGRRARPRHPAAALRVGTARRRGHVADRARSAARARRCGSPASATRRGSCRWCRRCARRSTAYVAPCPWPLAGDAPLFVGAKGGPLNADLVRRAVRRRAARGSACPTA